MSRKSLHNLTRQKNSEFENVTEGYEGFQALADIVEKYIDGAENVIAVLEVGAEEFVNDLKKLPKPISKLRKTGYTHLIDSFTYESHGNETVVGWGKYYGPMIENGYKKKTKKGYKEMSAKAHLNPCWDKNKEKYYKKMLTKLGMNTRD